MKICLHIHSEYSHDSDAPVKDIINTAKELGYDVISITDHNTAMGSLEALNYQDDKISVIPGAEFSTQYGHILTYFIDDTIEKNTTKIDSKRFDFFSLVENVRKINGVMILAHPFNSKLKDNMDILNYVDGIERYNSRLDSFYWKSQSDKFLKPLLSRDDFIYIGGPDAHSLTEISHCYTVTDNFGLEAKNFTNVLKNKNIIYYKTSVNYNISRSKFHNLKRFKYKFVVKNGIRMIFGIIEKSYNKMIGREDYETI